MYKLLIVDDEKMIRVGMQNGIDWNSLGIYSTFSAASAMEAQGIIERERPEILITDINMAQVTGLDLIEWIRTQTGNVEMKIIVLTGFDKFDYARKCLQMSVQNFLLKPIDEDELKHAVEMQIEKLEKERIEREKAERRVRTEGTRRQTDLEKAMRNLIHQKGVSDAEYPIDVPVDKMCIMQAAILIPEIYELDNKTEEEFRKLTIINICMSFIDARNEGLTFTDENGMIIVVFYKSSLSQKSMASEQNVTERIQNLCGILEDEYEISPRIVLGSEVEGIQNLFVSYNDAVYLLEQEQKSFHKIIKTKKEKNREEIIQGVYNEIKQELIKNIANGDRAMYIYEKYCQAVDSYNLSKRQVQGWCYEIYSNLYFSYVIETGDKVDNKQDLLLKALVGSTREEALEITRSFIGELVSSEESEQYENIVKARRFIDEHLDADISVFSMAEKFYMTPNYFSRTFKKVMKEGCNEYIVKKRIEKSKLLLETTTMKTGKIAMLVGYNDTNYFSLAFKKKVGMPPTKYREYIQEKRNAMGSLTVGDVYKG